LISSVPLYFQIGYVGHHLEGYSVLSKCYQTLNGVVGSWLSLGGDRIDKLERKEKVLEGRHLEYVLSLIERL